MQSEQTSIRKSTSRETLISINCIENHVGEHSKPTTNEMIIQSVMGPKFKKKNYIERKIAEKIGDAWVILTSTERNPKRQSANSKIKKGRLGE